MEGDAAIRTLVVVREPVVALGIRTVLAAAEGIEALPLPDPAADVRALVLLHAPDVLVLDVAFRREDPALVPELVRTHPGTRVLMYVDHSPAECSLRHMLESGGRAQLTPEALARLDECCLTSLRQMALGCVGRDVDLQAVVAAVRTVAAGNSAAAPWLASVTRTVQAATKASVQGAAISLRELEIMTLLAEGLTNREIADRLNVGEQTVKNHITRTMEKLGVRNRTEVGLLAARRRLRVLDPPEPGGS